jgi:hypothetical protein
MFREQSRSHGWAKASAVYVITPQFGKANDSLATSWANVRDKENPNRTTPRNHWKNSSRSGPMEPLRQLFGLLRYGHSLLMTCSVMIDH